MKLQIYREKKVTNVITFFSEFLTYKETDRQKNKKLHFYPLLYWISGSQRQKKHRQTLAYKETDRQKNNKLHIYQVLNWIYGFRRKDRLWERKREKQSER